MKTRNQAIGWHQCKTRLAQACIGLANVSIIRIALYNIKEEVQILLQIRLGFAYSNQSLKSENPCPSVFLNLDLRNRKLV